MEHHDDNDYIQGGGDIENDGRGRGLCERRESSFSSISEREGSMGEPLLTKRIVNNTSQIAIVGAKVYPIESLDYEYEIFMYFCGSLVSCRSLAIFLAFSGGYFSFLESRIFWDVLFICLFLQKW